MPFPIPAMTLPANIVPRLYEAIWMMAPILMMAEPRRTQFFRPRGSLIAQTEILQSSAQLPNFYMVWNRLTRLRSSQCRR